MHWPRSAPPCIEPYGRRQQGNTGRSRQPAASAEVSLQRNRTHRRPACKLAKQWTLRMLTVGPAHTTGPMPVVAESARRISPVGHGLTEGLKVRGVSGCSPASGYQNRVSRTGLMSRSA
jgi:hypothetical protein